MATAPLPLTRDTESVSPRSCDLQESFHRPSLGTEPIPQGLGCDFPLSLFSPRGLYCRKSKAWELHGDFGDADTGLATARLSPPRRALADPGLSGREGSSCMDTAGHSSGCWTRIYCNFPFLFLPFAQLLCSSGVRDYFCPHPWFLLALEVIQCLILLQPFSP